MMPGEVEQKKSSLHKRIYKALHVKTLFYSPLFLMELYTLRRSRDIGRLADFVFSPAGTPMKPLQVKSEIRSLLHFLESRKPKYILEIGTARGGTLYLFTRIAAGDALIASVDLPGGKYGGGYPKFKMPLYKSFALPGQEIRLIRADSHEAATLKEVKAVLGSNKLDFLFIDADHTYEGAKRDFEMYGPLVKKGGLIVLHDIVPSTWAGCGVDRFWKEIKDRYDSEEIVEDWKQNFGGIGIIKLKDGV